jgi:hypothetical protein
MVVSLEIAKHERVRYAIYRPYLRFFLPAPFLSYPKAFRRETMPAPCFY